MIKDILNKYLNNEKSGEISNYTLDGIVALLGYLGNPQENFKSVHIAGTNGKGSTAFMLGDILEKSGYKTGLFTSPHLSKINERIKINSCNITDSSLFKYVSKIHYIVESDNSILPTYFDLLTAAAFKYFSDESVDIAIIETGLGGRLDSTNVIYPLISIITDISLDHTGILGSNIAQITKEKCGIIKPGIPVITSNINPELLSIIEDYTDKSKSELFAYGIDFAAENIRRYNDNFIFDYFSENCKLHDIELPLFPVHQIKNASNVITALIYLKSQKFSNITDEIIYSELKKINVPGRFEILFRNPLIIYDPAHNYEAINNLINGIESYYPDKVKTFVFSIMKDKGDKNTLELLKESDAVYYLLDDERAYIPDKNQFNRIISDDNILIDIILKNDFADKMIVFAGTFRIYNYAVDITEKIRKLVAEKNTDQDRL